MSDEPRNLAKIIWRDLLTGEVQEFVLTEGATASIGRLETNDICIKEQHVSRQHAVVNYRDGIFMITDLGSANGTFVNDQKLVSPFPLASGDIIRLYVPMLQFSAAVSELDRTMAEQKGTLITALSSTGRAKLIVTTGPQEGNTIPLLLNKVTIGRATSKAEWEICLQDASVSRPHARLEVVDDAWVLTDLGSANGTKVNGSDVTEKGRVLHDGDVVSVGSTVALFRAG